MQINETEIEIDMKPVLTLDAGRPSPETKAKELNPLLQGLKCLTSDFTFCIRALIRGVRLFHRGWSVL